jgi:hypothetical protein
LYPTEKNKNKKKRKKNRINKIREEYERRGGACICGRK